MGSSRTSDQRSNYSRLRNNGSHYNKNNVYMSLVIFLRGALRGSILPFGPTWFLQTSSSSLETMAYGMSMLVGIGIMSDVIRIFFPKIVRCGYCCFGMLFRRRKQQLANHTTSPYYGGVGHKQYFTGLFVSFTVLSWNASTVPTLLFWRACQIYNVSTATSSTPSNRRNKSKEDRVWLSGFTFSVFMNGVLYRVLRKSSLHQETTKDNPNATLHYCVISSIIIICGLILDSILRYVLSYLGIVILPPIPTIEDEEKTTQQNNYSSNNLPLISKSTSRDSDCFYDCASEWEDEIDFSDHDNNDNDFDDVEIGIKSPTSEKNDLKEDEWNSYLDSKADNHYCVNPDTYPYYDHNQITVYSKENNICIFENNEKNVSNCKDKTSSGDSKDIVEDSNGVVLSCVLTGQTPNVVPECFRKFHKSYASQKWEQTKRWRMEHQLHCIHTFEHVNFDAIKNAYFHVIHGKDKEGNAVIYERPGSMNLKHLFGQQGLVVDDMIWHYSYFMEYLANIVFASNVSSSDVDEKYDNKKQKEWGFSVVMDVKGASLSMMSGDVLKYMKRAGDINSSHYPNSMKMVLCANSPFWLSGAFGVLKGILPANTSIEVMSSGNSQIETMTKYIDIHEIPKEYGGTSPYPLGQHPYELQLKELVQAQKNKKSKLSTNIKNSAKKKVTSKTPNKSLLSSNHNELLTPTLPHEERMLPYFATRAEEETNLVFRTPRSTPSVNKNNDTMSPEFGQHSCRRSNNKFNDVVRARTVSFESSATVSSYNNMNPLSPLQQHHVISLTCVPNSKKSDDRISKEVFSEEIILLLVSTLHGLLCMIQGWLEVLIPLWFTIQLNYGPPQCGIVLFCMGMVLLWTTRTKLYKKSFLKFPLVAPMPAYRLSVGASALLLCLFPSSSSSGRNATSRTGTSSTTMLSSINNKDKKSASDLEQDYDMLAMTCAIIVLAFLFVSILLGRLSSKKLHQTASAAYIDKLSLSCDDATFVGRTLTSITNGIRYGRLTDWLSVFGEMAGALMVAPVYIYFSSSNQHESIPFIIIGFICGILYTLSFALQIGHNSISGVVNTTSRRSWWNKVWHLWHSP